MPYTREDAEREVGDSTDWIVGLEASIKKFEQRVGGDVGSYRRDAHCGLCFVSDNRSVKCHDCPGKPFCCSEGERGDKEVLQALKKLRKELDPMDCSKRCANFKPKSESPFPEGLKTEDLKVGMVVTRGGRSGSFVYTILKPPSRYWLRVFRASLGFKPCEDTISLADHGCQPYENGVWNQWNWLRKVK